MQETFTLSGVNSSTGDIQFDGAVIVNGDVSDDKEINASGNVTINGFVESAYIRSGGDIIITEGAIGKLHDEDCRLVADGSIFIDHAQGLDMVAGKDIRIQKQLAYSNVKCKGSLILGSVEHPNGIVFASKIACGNSVSAGTLGALSGSTLILDFSEGYNATISKLDALTTLCHKLSHLNANHASTLSTISEQYIPEFIKRKFMALNDMIASENMLLAWLQTSIQTLQDRLNAYEEKALVVVNEELFPGVSVKLNANIWRCEREYKRSKIMLNKGSWVHKLTG